MNEINSLADEKIKKVSLCKFSLNWKGACFIKDPTQGPLRPLVDLTESVIILWMFLFGFIALGIGWLLNYWQVQTIAGILVLFLGLVSPIVGYFVQLIFKPHSTWTFGVYFFLAVLTMYLGATVIRLPPMILLIAMFVAGTFSVWALLVSECIEQKPYIFEGIGLFVALLLLLVSYVTPISDISLAPLGDINLAPLLKLFVNIGILTLFFGLLIRQFVRIRIDTLGRVRRSALAIVLHCLDVDELSVASNTEANSSGVANNNNEEINGNGTINCHDDIEGLARYSIAKYGVHLDALSNNWEEIEDSGRRILMGKSSYEETVALANPNISKKVDALLNDEFIASQLYKSARLSMIRLVVPLYVIFTGLFFSVLRLVVSVVFR
ncbi:MAG: hypothetical protein SOY76_06705 [Veillonella caviae]|nr:hypothetical protein [Veillonella caviae]